MRAKSFQICLTTSITLAALTHSAAAADTFDRLQPHHVAALTALNEAVVLMGHTDQPVVSADEMELYKKIAAGQASKCDESDAILVVSGVTDKATRESYIAKIKKITDQARQVVADAKTPEKKADASARYLYKNPLHGGFDDGQVNMRKVLDDGKFNCVSSSVLFNLVGNQLGLKTIAVTIPGHVFLRMDNLIIEPVAGTTLTADTHELIVNDFWLKATSNWKTIFGNNRTFESGNLGLIGEIYVDECNFQLAKNHTEQAVATILKAACLDPKHPATAYQLEATLHTWFNLTLKQKNYDKAQKIAAIYGQLLRNSSSKLFQQVAAARGAKLVAKS